MPCPTISWRLMKCRPGVECFCPIAGFNSAGYEGIITRGSNFMDGFLARINEARTRMFALWGGFEMKSTMLVILGLLLIGVAALWFLSPVPDLVLAPGAPDAEFSTRGAGGQTVSAMKWAEIVFDALNAFFGAMGVFLTLKGWRLGRSGGNAAGGNAPGGDVPGGEA